MNPTIEQTLTLAKNYHQLSNATDKGGKTPYYWHLLRVMLRIKNPTQEQMHIALLHDVIEDTSLTLEDLKNHGYSEHIIECIKWCSRNMFPDLTFTQWMVKIGQEAPEDAIIVKIADISDNLGFERMQGLMNKGKSQSPKKSSHQYPLQLRIDKKVNKKMRLHGEMGVYDRYYKGWNNIFENEKNISLINKVELADFSSIEQLKKLMNYLPQKEQLVYIEHNKINTWQIQAQIAVINDRAGNPYLALNVNNDIGQLYQSFLMGHIDSDYINNQKKRDGNSFHITLIPSMSFSKIMNQEEYNNIIQKNIGKTFDFFSYGIGSIQEENKNKKAWFVILENPELQLWRDQFFLPRQDFHITLAFKTADVFSKRKNKDSQVYTNNQIWNEWIMKDFTLTKSKKLKV